MTQIATPKPELLLKSLQVYRGFAAVLVVLVHLSLFIGKDFHEAFYTNMWRFGTNGVKFFFVLSGFIIYHAHARELGRRELLGTYALKRITRIYPPYWIVTLAMLPIWYFTTIRGPKPSGSLLCSLLLLPQSVPPFVEVGWTLVHEVLFYTLFAFLFFNARWIYAGFLWAIGIAVYTAMGYTSHYLVDFFFSIYNLLFLLGVLIGVSHEKFRPPGWLAGAATIAGLALYVYGAVQVYHWVFDPLPELRMLGTGNQVIFFGIASGLLVFGCGHPQIEERFFSSRFLLFLGAASYSIYLIHVPVQSFTGKLVRAAHLEKVLPNFVIWLLLAAASVAVGCAFHVWIEAPILRALKNAIRRKRIENHSSLAAPAEIASVTDEA